MNRIVLVVVLVLVSALARPAQAQNPVQWNASPRAAIARAQEQSLPLLFWVTERSDWDKDDQDLRDAQEVTFRDPAVVALAQTRFVPVRVARSNSNVLKEAESLGLPTNFGLYVAILTPDGKLVDQIGPGEVAEPEAFAARLAAASRKYGDDLYNGTLKAIITSPDSPKPEVRKAVQLVWRLGIVSADKDLVGLLDRTDVTSTERARLYSLLGSFATPVCIEALLSRAADGDRDAITALGRAEPGALPTLLADLPSADGEDATPRQLAAYQAACRISRIGNPRPASFWTSAKPEQRTAELERVKSRAEPVFDYWKENAGRGR